MVRSQWLASAVLLLGMLVPVTAGARQSAATAPLRADHGALDAGATGLHTCARLLNGATRCWGYGFFGELGVLNVDNVGDDETPASRAPVDLGAGRYSVDLALGNVHSCAILDDGSVRCWGTNDTGRGGQAIPYQQNPSIGDNETPGSLGPVDLGPGRIATAIAAGDAHTCVILDTGDMRCWGGNGSGQLGIGSSATIGDDETPGSIPPVDLGSGRTATAIAAGGDDTCAILDTGDVRCWGDNSGGQLGLGSTTTIGDDESPASVPVVNLGPGRTASAIGAGGVHACAILDTGDVRCWGYGDSRLGLKATENVGDDEAPGSVPPVALGLARTAIALGVGGGHNCAILDDRSLRCWGWNNEGQLGLGTYADVGDNETPAEVATVDLGAQIGVRAIATGQFHTCALTYEEAVRCWGAGAFGRLGTGSSTSSVSSPMSVPFVDVGGLVGGGPADAAPPETVITSGPDAVTTATSASFSFSSSEAGATFACRLDAAEFAACTTPLSLAQLTVGSHTLEARSTDRAGNVDPTPAVHTWRIEREPVGTPPDGATVPRPPSAVPSTTSPSAFRATSIFLMPSARRCLKRPARLTLAYRKTRAVTISRVEVFVGKRRVIRRTARDAARSITLRRLPAGKFRLSIKVTAQDGRTATASRSYTVCKRIKPRR